MILLLLVCQYATYITDSKNYYTAQQKFSTDFNTMSHFEWTWTILSNVINMYGDLEIYIFLCPPDKKLSGKASVDRR